MHPAWCIDDIRYCIFEYLTPQDLARLARTGKIFFDFAADPLWKTITSFDPFLHCLPLDFRQRVLQAEDVQRLDFYAAKVQNLLLETKSAEEVMREPQQFRVKKKSPKHVAAKSWGDVWKEIAELRPTPDFMPNLHRLRLSSVIEELLIPLVGISGLNLSQLKLNYIHGSQPQSVVQEFLDRLADTPKLEYLFVRDGAADIVPPKVIQRSPLKHLRFDPRIHARKHQANQFKQLPLQREILLKSALEHLTLGLTREWYSPAIESIGAKYFPALKTLWLHLTTMTPEPCEPSCANQGRHSWTCSGSKPVNRALPSDKPTDCARRPPTLFISSLNNPQLTLLNIRFPLEATGPMFLDVVRAVNSSCQLDNLTDLALAGGGFINNCGECGRHPGPSIKPHELREAMFALLPLPRLKSLRISVAPNFLDVLDLDLYRSIAAGLPSLQWLALGHREFHASSLFEGEVYYERIPLHHLAAFCCLLHDLEEVSLGTADGMKLEEAPREEWACYGVKKLRIGSWADSEGAGGRGGGVSYTLLHLGLRTYFPLSNLAQSEYDPRERIFDEVRL